MERVSLCGDDLELSDSPVPVVKPRSRVPVGVASASISEAASKLTAFRGRRERSRELGRIKLEVISCEGVSGRLSAVCSSFMVVEEASMDIAACEEAVLK